MAVINDNRYDFEYVAECKNDPWCTKGEFLTFKTNHVLSIEIKIKCPRCGWPATLEHGIRELKNND